MKSNYEQINLSKANFDEIYSSADPREYFAELGALDYMVPDLAQPVVHQLLAALRQRRTAKPLVLDIGCSYGINAAVHRFPVSFNTLRRRYTRGEMARLDSVTLARLDRHYYESWPDAGLGRFIGLDSSAPAISYARSVGLIDDGVATDLETASLTPEQAALVANTDLILATGCVGYVTDITYRRLVEQMKQPPWVVSFVLRMFDYEPMAAALADYGLVTERLAGATFAQRRFRDEREFANTLEMLRSRGKDPRGLESEGLFQAELFVSRPRKDVEACPLTQLVTVSSGRQRSVGTRFVLVETAGGARVVRES